MGLLGLGWFRWAASVANDASSTQARAPASYTRLRQPPKFTAEYGGRYLHTLLQYSSEHLSPLFIIAKLHVIPPLHISKHPPLSTLNTSHVCLLLPSSSFSSLPIICVSPFSWLSIPLLRIHLVPLLSPPARSPSIHSYTAASAAKEPPHGYYSSSKPSQYPNITSSCLSSTCEARAVDHACPLPRKGYV
jgi:hypothetical protein